MTKDEFMEKYGKEIVNFESYYKYTFSFVGLLTDLSEIRVRRGQYSDDIYKFEVDPTPRSINSIYPYMGKVIKNGVVIDEFYED